MVGDLRGRRRPLVEVLEHEAGCSEERQVGRDRAMVLDDAGCQPVGGSRSFDEVDDPAAMSHDPTSR